MARVKETKAGLLLDVPVALVHRNENQPRQHFDVTELRSLAASIDENGQAVPAVLRAHPRRAGEYEIVAGERRWRAIMTYCTKVETLRAVVIDEPDDAKAFRVSFVENEHRQDLYPLERAVAMQRLVDGGATHERIAAMVGRSTAYVSFHLSLLTLHPKVKALLDPALPEKQRLAFSAAVAIARVPRAMQPEIAALAVKRGTRLGDVQEMVHNALDSIGRAPKERRNSRGHGTLRTNLERLDGVLRRRFGTVAAIESSYHIHGHVASGEIEATIEAARSVARNLEAFAGRLAQIRKRRAA